MKSIFFHLMPYRDLPADFESSYESIWVTPPNAELCDPRKVAQYYQWNLDELELADRLGFDGVGVNEHHQNGYGFMASPNLMAAALARRTPNNSAMMVLGNTLALYSPATRVAEEFAMLDVLSNGRLAAGFPVGTSMDVNFCYGIPPTQTRPRFREAEELIIKAWTQPGPFTFNGRFNQLRYVNPWPQPLQKPHPPVWLAGGGSVETWELAATKNYTYSYLSFFGAKFGKKLMDGSGRRWTSSAWTATRSGPGSPSRSACPRPTSGPRRSTSSTSRTSSRSACTSRRTSSRRPATAPGAAPSSRSRPTSPATSPRPRRWRRTGRCSTRRASSSAAARRRWPTG